MRVAFSPCPNDTYLFYAWIHQKISSPLIAEPSYADIQQLNEWALQGAYPLIKISFALLPHILNTYELLPVGAALGHHCGPKIIAKTKRQEFGRIAIPGKLTTAHLLFDRLGLKAEQKHFCRYDEVYKLLHEDTVDAGLIIHESRFTFEKEGFVECLDLGELWADLLPLGCLAIKRDFPHTPELISTLKRSLEYAHQHPEEAYSYIIQHSQEKDPAVVYNHIKTYVNAESACLSEAGIQAIERLINCEADTFCPNLRSKSHSGQA